MGGFKAKTTHILKSQQQQLTLYLIFGLMAFMADFGALKIGLVIGLPLLVSTTIGVTVGFVVSYLGNHFRIGTVARTKKKKESLPLFTALFIWNILFTYLFIRVFNHHFSVPLIVPKALSVGCIMVWNYLLFHFIFTDRTHQLADEII